MRLPVLAALVFGLVLAILMAGIRPGLGKGSGEEGETVPAPAATARRIVCVSPGLVEVLFTIGAGPKVVGCPDFLTAPPAALALPRVGGAFNPGLERILKLRPDLIVTQGRAAKLRRFAGNHRIPLVGLPLDTLGDLLAAYDRLGAVTGLADEAAARARDLRFQLLLVKEWSARQGPGPRVFLALGHRAGTLAGLYTATDATFLGQVLRVAGGRNLFPSSPSLWPTISLESLRAADPEVIVELKPGETPDRKRLLEDWQAALPGVAAVRNGRIHLLTADHLLLPGPRLAATARTMARLLHPKADQGRLDDPGR